MQAPIKADLINAVKLYVEKIISESSVSGIYIIYISSLNLIFILLSLNK